MKKEDNSKRFVQGTSDMGKSKQTSKAVAAKNKFNAMMKKGK